MCCSWEGGVGKLDLDLRNWLRWKRHFENAVVADLKYRKAYK
jgi:hypothetical protein